MNYSGTPSDVSRVKYGYDFAGNRTWREDTVAKAQMTPQYHDEFYTYDGLHRLKDAQRGQLTGTHPNYTGVTSKNFAQDWTLDQLGNWPAFKQDNDGNSSWDVNQTRAHNGVNEITEIDSSSTAVTHDAAGNMTKVPTSVDTFTARYDAWNRLVSLSNGPTYKYYYDGLGRRIQKLQPGGAPTLDYYYNEGWQLLEERQGGDADPKAQYVWHPYYIDALAVRYYDGDTDGVLTEGNDGRHYYLQDANYNVTAVVNDSGAVLERYRYTAYGEVSFLDTTFTGLFGNASQIANTHLYTGRERDPESGMQLNRWRWYASHLGRWLTRDPIGYEGGGNNLYEYVGGMPLIGTDPYGLYMTLCTLNRIGMLVCDPISTTEPCTADCPDGSGPGTMSCKNCKQCSVWGLFPYWRNVRRCTDCEPSPGNPCYMSPEEWREYCDYKMEDWKSRRNKDLSP